MAPSVKFLEPDPQYSCKKLGSSFEMQMKKISNKKLKEKKKKKRYHSSHKNKTKQKPKNKTLGMLLNKLLVTRVLTTRNTGSDMLFFYFVVSSKFFA